MIDRGKVIRPLQAKLDEVKADGLDVMLCSTEIIENVITLLKEQEAMEQCLKTKCIICPHCDNCDVDENGLLKEQEPKPVLPVDIRPANERFATMKLGYCPKCGKKINSVDHKNYCGECSQAVKWDN